MRDGRSRHGGWRHPRFEGLSTGLALPPKGQGHTASTITAARHDCTNHRGSARFEGKTGARYRAEKVKAPPMPARRAVQHSALTNETKARGTPGSRCARRTAAMDVSRRGTRAGAARLPIPHLLSCASDVSAYAVRRRLAARLSLGRRGLFSPVRG